MTKKNKFENAFTRQKTAGEIPVFSEEVTVGCEIKIEQPLSESEGNHVYRKDKSPIFINAVFSEEIVEIGYTFLATGEQNVVTASNGRINMLQGRMYYITTGREDIDSDNYNIKVHSNVADRFDIRFIKDGLVAVIPIRHNAVLKNGERLCVLTPLIC